MNRTLFIIMYLGLGSLFCQAEDISLLYRQYLSQQGKAQVETGNKLLADAYQQGLIDSVGTFASLTDEMQAWVHYSSASWAWDQGELDQVAEPAKKALDFAIAWENLSLEGDCYHLLGAEAQMRGNVYRAIEYFEKCYEADKQLNDPDRMSSSLNNLAGNYLSTDQAEQAETYILKAIELERTMNRPEKLAIRLGMASDIYLKLGKPQASLPYITEAYELDSLGNRTMKMAIRLSQRASVYEALKRNDDARRCLLQALAIFAGTTNVRSTAICYNQLGNLALAEGKNYQAEEYFTHAVELSRSCQDRLAESKACKGLSVVLRDKHPARALDYLMRYSELTDTIFSERMAQKLSQIKAKYDNAEEKHQAELMKQRIQHQRTLLVLAAVFLTVIVLGGIGLYVYNKRKPKELPSVPAAPAPVPEKPVVREDILQDIHLTKREKEIANLCCEGLQDKEIAARLNISERTVGTHKLNIFKKCGVSNTVELVRLYLKKED